MTLVGTEWTEKAGNSPGWSVAASVLTAASQLGSVAATPTTFSVQKKVASLHRLGPGHGTVSEGRDLCSRGHAHTAHGRLQIVGPEPRNCRELDKGSQLLGEMRLDMRVTL